MHDGALQIHVAREFLRSMAQPFDRAAVGRSLLSQEQLDALEAATKAAGTL